MADELLTDAELVDIEARAQAAPNIRVDDSGTVYRGYNVVAGKGLDEELGRLLLHAKPDILRRIAEIRRLRAKKPPGDPADG